jgi:hypothetical protein
MRIAINNDGIVGDMLVPTVMNWFAEPASSVKPVGDDDLGDG